MFPVNRELMSPSQLSGSATRMSMGLENSHCFPLFVLTLAARDSLNEDMNPFIAAGDTRPHDYSSQKVEWKRTNCAEGDCLSSTRLRLGSRNKKKLSTATLQIEGIHTVTSTLEISPPERAPSIGNTHTSGGPFCTAHRRRRRDLWLFSPAGEAQRPKR